MLSRLSSGRHFLTQSPSLRIKFQIRYVFQPSRSLSISREKFATVTNGSIAGSKEAKKLLASFLVKPGSEIQLEDILGQLPQLPADHHLHLNSALFLVTPSLASFFEPSHKFHASVINHIFGQRTFGPRPQSVIAVVDAISKNDSLAPTNESIQGGEGIAVCISGRLGTVEEEDGTSDAPLINFAETDSIKSGKMRITSYLAPVANTLFINGREHTIIRQDWRPNSQGEWTQDLEPVQLRSINVNVNDSLAEGTNATSVLRTPLEDLTEPAEVKSSMGNIVRELKTSSGSIISASTELEEIVPNLLKRRTSAGQEGELRVYALVYPSSHRYTGGDAFKNIIKLPEEQSVDRKRIHEHMLSSMVRNGGRIYRVTSGGAGWGKKAGLLSLEPKVDVRRQGVPEPIMPEFIFSNKGVTMPDSQQLLPPGSMIQFLATFSGRKNEEEFAQEETTVKKVAQANHIESWRPDSWFDGGRLQSMCIGTSSVTNLPEAEIPDSTEENDSCAETPRLQSGMTFSPNTFGFLSNSPMGIVSSLYDEHFSEGDDAIASRSTHLSSTSTRNDSTLKLSVSSFTTLIEPPGTSFTMAFSADSGKESVAKNRVRSRQPAHPIVRRYILEPEANGTTSQIWRFTQMIPGLQLEKTDSTGTGVVDLIANAGDLAKSNAWRVFTKAKFLRLVTDIEERLSRIEIAVGTVERMVRIIKAKSEFRLKRISFRGPIVSKGHLGPITTGGNRSRRLRITRVWMTPEKSWDVREVVKSYKEIKLGKSGGRIRQTRSRVIRGEPRRVGSSKISPRMFQSGLEEQAALQRQYYSRNRIESQNLLGLPSNEGEEDTLRALKEISADVIQGEAFEAEMKKPSISGAFGVSIYGGLKDRVATKAAVDDLMEGLKEDSDHKV